MNDVWYTEHERAEFRLTHDCGMCGRTGMVYDGYFKCRHDGAWYPCDENHAEPGCWAGRR